MDRPINDRPLSAGNAEQIDEFVAMSELSKTTLQKYKGHLEEFARWLDRPLLDATRKDVKRFLGYLKTPERKVRNRKGEILSAPLSASTRKSALVAIRAFWVHCAELELTETDPTFGIKCPPVEVKRGLTIGPKEIKLFLDARGSERCRVQAHLAVFTAARSASIRGLHWDDIDFDANLIHFQGKRRKNYTLPIHDQLRAALLRWRREQASQAESNPALEAALADSSTAYTLLTRKGQPISHTTLGKQVKWRAARAGILPHSDSATVGRENKSRLSPHALRRSFATILRSQGLSLGDIAEILNHSDINTTRRHYAFTDNPVKRRTINQFRLADRD